MNSIPRTIIIMGVSGCGKSLIGRMLADSVGGMFEDADAFHPAENISKMSASIPLTDEDRMPWFAILRARIVAMRDRTPCYVLACSALKQRYRDFLRKDDPAATLVFVHLQGSKDLVRERLNARAGHFMPASLLDSQFAALEEPQDAVRIDIGQAPDQILRELRLKLGLNP